MNIYKIFIIIIIFYPWYFNINTHIKELYASHLDLDIDNMPDLGHKFLFLSWYPFLLLFIFVSMDKIPIIYRGIRYIYTLSNDIYSIWRNW